MGPKQEQTISALDNSVTPSVPFSLCDAHSDITLDVSATYTSPDWNVWQKPSVTSGILDQKISRHDIIVHTV